MENKSINKLINYLWFVSLPHHLVETHHSPWRLLQGTVHAIHLMIEAASVTKIVSSSIPPPQGG